MKIPKTESEKILVCNGALAYYCSGSFYSAYDVCEAPGDKEIITKYKKLIEALSECIVDAMMNYMGKLEPPQQGGLTRETVSCSAIVTIASTHHTLQCVNGERAKVLAIAGASSGLLWELQVELEKSKEQIYVGFDDVEIVNE